MSNPFLRYSALAGTSLVGLALGACAQTPPATTAANSVVIVIDAAANRHPISPAIYGVAFAGADQLADLNCQLNRQGGNGMTRYNWQTNSSNHASDWFFESLPGDSATPAADVDSFVAASKIAGAQPMLTIPTLGWVAKLGPNRAHTYAFSVAKYGPQQKADPNLADAGNGVKPDGTNIAGNDPNDANQPVGPDFQRGLVQHLVQKYGKASAGGVKYYLMDNEPGIWQSTHRDVRPVGVTMDETVAEVLTYGTMVKSVDPGALVVAPEEWGWTGYVDSGYDSQWGGAHGWDKPLPDRAKHGGMDMQPYLLDQLHKHDQQAGRRTLDVFSLHYYPQGGEFQGPTDTAMQLRRNRSTRSLWDPNYKDETWINDTVKLIPRMKAWVAQYYPGTKTAITEYNWGAEDHINGATAQADIWGIFGREGLDMAARWATPDAKTPTYKAMKLYRNYDGHKSAFGDVSVSDAVPNPDELSSFAAVRSTDGALTVMVINKSLTSGAAVTARLAHFTARGPAQAWQLTSANTITPLAPAALTGGSLQATVPAQSVTLFVIPGKSPAR